MLISQLSDYLQQHRRASVQDMVLHLDSSTEAVQAMLDLLERKRRVRRLGDAGSACGRCGGCTCSSPASPAYEWVTPPQAP